VRRTSSVQIDAPGQDSFLDVVCNLVGILVILVMVVAAHAKSSLVARQQQGQPASSPRDEVQQAEAAAAAVERGVYELEARIARQDFEIAYRNAEREQLQKLVLLTQQQLAERHQKLSAQEQARIDAAQELGAARGELARLELALQTDLTPPSSALPHLPTPMATTVFSGEVHFRLLGGRLAYVPYDEMLEQLKAIAPTRLEKLKSAPRIEESLPVVCGFGGKYILRRTDAEIATRVGPTRTSTIELEMLWLVDAEENLGEPFEAALRAGSQFRTRLAGRDPQRTVVTVWVYPDSFQHFRQLKEELYKLGFLTAARPLPMGMAIGGGPSGTRSAAE
jgi:hypothetical protein